MNFIEDIKQYFDTIGVNLVKYCKFAAIYRNLQDEETRNLVLFEGMSNNTIQKEYGKEMKELFIFLKTKGYKFTLVTNGVENPDSCRVNLFDTDGEDVVRVNNELGNIIDICTKSINRDNPISVFDNGTIIYVPSMKIKSK